MKKENLQRRRRRGSLLSKRQIDDSICSIFREKRTRQDGMKVSWEGTSHISNRRFESIGRSLIEFVGSFTRVELDLN